MATVIRQSSLARAHAPNIRGLAGILPRRLFEELERLSRGGALIEEIRIRTGRRCFVGLCGESVELLTVCGKDEVDAMVLRICEDSLYAHAHTITQGYVTLEGGIRVGIVGRAFERDGRIAGVYDVSALCIRLPKRIDGIGGEVCRIVRRLGGVSGVLVYSPPGEGKTTLLRAVIASLASPPRGMRIAVVDTRGELGCYLQGEELSVDILSGYPRGIGIEIAARTMNPQLIACDEIGGAEEAEAIAAAQNCGAPLLATAHASSLASLMKRSGIARLCERGVFGAYVGIRRKREMGAADFEYTVNGENAGDGDIQNNGSLTDIA